MLSKPLKCLACQCSIGGPWRLQMSCLLHPPLLTAVVGGEGGVAASAAALRCSRLGLCGGPGLHLPDGRCMSAPPAPALRHLRCARPRWRPRAALSPQPSTGAGAAEGAAPRAHPLPGLGLPHARDLLVPPHSELPPPLPLPLPFPCPQVRVPTPPLPSSAPAPPHRRPLQPHYLG